MARYTGREMTTLWPRIEPLLARVQKPARYIGCEDGMVGPGARRPARVGLAAHLPRHLRDRAAQPGPADPLRAAQRARPTPRRAGLRPVGRHGGAMRRPRRAAVLGRHAPSGGRVRPAGLQPVGRAGLHQRPELHRPGRRAGPGAERGPSHPLVAAGGHCTFNPEPLADFVDLFVIGDGEEVVTEITEVVGEWKRCSRRDARVARAACCGAGHRSPASTSRRCTRSPTTARGWSKWRPATPTCPPRSRSAPSPTWPRGPTPSTSWSR